MDEKIENMNKIYKFVESDVNYIFNNINNVENEINIFMNVINNNVIETTRNITDSKWFNLTNEYTSLQNKAECLDFNWPHLYNDKCYSKCPIDSSFMIDISGNPVCNQIEKIKEDKTVNKEIYKCPDGFFYKKDKNDKEVCISCRYKKLDISL